MLISTNLLNIVMSTALLIGSILTALASAGAGIGTMIYNKNEAQRNRDFQERMSNTAIQRSIADAQQAGISPSLVLGGASQPMGATANGNGGLEHAFANTANMLSDYIIQDRKLDAMERMQNEMLENKQDMQSNYLENRTQMQNEYLENRTQMQNEYLEHQTQLAQMKMANSANNNKFTQHKFTKKELNSLFDDLDTIKLK